MKVLNTLSKILNPKGQTPSSPSVKLNCKIWWDGIGFASLVPTAPGLGATEPTAFLNVLGPWYAPL